MAGARECRMIRDLVLNSQATEPAIRHVDRKLATEHSLRADRKHITNDKHPDNQLRINRWPTSAGIIGRELLAYPRQIDKRCYFANQVIVGDNLFQRERIEKLCLVTIEPPHHGLPPQRIASKQANHRSRKPSTTFATKSARTRSANAQHQCRITEVQRT